MRGSDCSINHLFALQVATCDADDTSQLDEAQVKEFRHLLKGHKQKNKSEKSKDLSKKDVEAIVEKLPVDKRLPFHYFLMSEANPVTVRLMKAVCLKQAANKLGLKLDYDGSGSMLDKLSAVIFAKAMNTEFNKDGERLRPAWSRD